MMTLLTYPLAPWQALVLQYYCAGEYAYLADSALNAKELHNQLNSCGDGLLRFLLVELDPREDCDSFAEAQRRIRAAIDDMYGVVAGFHLATEIERSATSGQSA